MSIFGFDISDTWKIYIFYCLEVRSYFLTDIQVRYIRYFKLSFCHFFDIILTLTFSPGVEKIFEYFEYLEYRFWVWPTGPFWAKKDFFGNNGNVGILLGILLLVKPNKKQTPKQTLKSNITGNITIKIKWNTWNSQML